MKRNWQGACALNITLVILSSRVTLPDGEIQGYGSTPEPNKPGSPIWKPWLSFMIKVETLRTES